MQKFNRTGLARPFSFLAAGGLAAAASLVVTSGALGQATSKTFLETDADRWMYSSNQTPGTRSIAPVFGAVGQGDVDRFGQFVIGFDTDNNNTNDVGAPIPSGLGASNYRVLSAVVTAVESSGTFDYDPTYDSIATYETGGTDPDAGRPMELHGLGFRSPYTHFNLGTGPGTAWAETSPQSVAGGRSAYALGFDAAGNRRDVGNNVTAGFESSPWAIGKNDSVTPNAAPPAGTTFSFDIDVDDPNVQQYLRESLDGGALGFSISSLALGAQPGSSGPSVTYPAFFTRDNVLHSVPDGDYYAPQLQITYEIVPEPSSALLASLAVGGLLARRPGRNRRAV